MRSLHDITDTTHAVTARRWRTLPNAWRLIYPFWVSKHRWMAYGLLTFLLGETFLTTWISVFFNGWNGRFMDALTRYDGPAIWPLLFQFVGIIAAFVFLSIASLLASSTLTITWRTWLTHRFLHDWLGRETFYRIEREQSVDNPDQRITVDIAALVEQTQTIFLDFIRTVASLIAFTGILWHLSGPLGFTLFGQHWIVPGYMVWTAIVYAFVTSWLVHLVGRRLMPLTFRQERAEADFRFMMAGVREHAEQIALYHGSDTESARMQAGFVSIRKNFWQIVRFKLRFDPVNTTLLYVSALFPMFATLPRYLAHVVTLGGMQQLSGAFSQVNGNLSWFINSYSKLQAYRVVVERLSGLNTEIDAVPDNSKNASGTITHSASSTSNLIVQELTLCTPGGRWLAQPITLTVAPGERWLIRGPSGVGKSTLMRAMAGIWPYGSGTIRIPEQAKLLFLSQKNYVPPGTLKAALCYPSTESSFDEAACRQALIDCRLPDYIDCLEEVARWSQRLSPGEQQRLAAARALLQCPDYLFLDESTSALDSATEQHIWTMLAAQLPHTAMVSISHGPTDEVMHVHTLTMIAMERADHASNAQSNIFVEPMATPG